MSTTRTYSATKVSVRIGLSALAIALLAPSAHADDTLRTFYPTGTSNSSTQISPGAAPDYQSGGKAPQANGGHLPSAMPNPATQQSQGGMSAQAEHQRVVENMRRHGYSEDRIRALDPYIHQQADPPGTTYRTIGGIRVRNDGMTPGQALHNITTNGIMNTPISTDRNYYASGTYGYYRNHGGTRNYDQWLHGER